LVGGVALFEHKVLKKKPTTTNEAGNWSNVEGGNFEPFLGICLLEIQII
jgi:hypothetical protein